MHNFIKLLITGFTLSFSCYAGTSQIMDVDENTGIVSWKIKAHGVSFSLTQILPEQARAFYVNRGFTLKQSEEFAASCVYMTVMRNDSAPGTIHFKRSDWSVSVNNKPHQLKSVHGGDWNQGMLSLGLPAASQFDLTVRWDVAGEKYETMLQGVQCAK